MSLRLIEIILPKESTDVIDQLPSNDNVLGRWDDLLNDGQAIVRILVDAANTEAMLDDLEDRFSHLTGFRVILLPVEATLPRPSEFKDEESKQSQKSPERISREEIYADVAEGAKVSRTFIAQVVIATVVAAVGLMRDDNAVIIGAMVIAPLLGPNMSLCLATTLGDARLAIESFKANAVGLAVALAVSLLLGTLFLTDPEIASIKSRTQVSSGDILSGVASGLRRCACVYQRCAIGIDRCHGRRRAVTTLRSLWSVGRIRQLLCCTWGVIACRNKRNLRQFVGAYSRSRSKVCNPGTGGRQSVRTAQ